VVGRDEHEAEHEPGPDEPHSIGHPGLELEDDPDFQRRTWAFQRCGWVVIALILAAALLGLAGHGPLSHAHQIQRDAPLALEYERFGRHGSESTIRLHLLPGSTRQGRARVRLDRAFYENVDALQVVPEPESSAADARWITLTFATEQPERPTVVVINYTPTCYGPLPGRVGLEGTEPIRFEQFIYP
jgi:hypothetical protein